MSNFFAKPFFDNPFYNDAFFQNPFFKLPFFTGIGGKQIIPDTHFDDINQIDIELIKKDLESSYYKGLLKVELK